MDTKPDEEQPEAAEAESLDLVAPPAPSGKLTNAQILLGKKHDPIELIKIYPEDEWERFAREWVESLKARYGEVRHASGAGDRGRDIVAYVDSVNAGGEWDNYQCKHYDHALYPSDIWKELAKLCYYTYVKVYSRPRFYYFVAPQGIGPEALLLFENPQTLRSGLIARWEKGDLLRVSKKEIKLEGGLRTYVENFNFDIVKDVPPSQIIGEHRETRYYAPRFGGGLVRLPPDKVAVPAEIAAKETRYVEQLLEAYSDHLSHAVSLDGLGEHPLLKRHFDRQRKHFFLTEELRNFTRDNIPEDGCFERLQDAIHDGVIDTAESQHADGLERIKETIARARDIQVDSHPLKECLEGYHRSGICHQLANEDRLTWVP